MPLIQNILFPVDFSPSCIAMAGYVQRAAALFSSARVTLLHVVDLASHNGFELYLRPTPEISDEHYNLACERLKSFLATEFPVATSPRILVSGDAATQIAKTARDGKFDLIVMPTHSGVFRQTLLGSTTAKVLDDADCPVLTSRHAETHAPHPIEHREWVCAIGLSRDSERVLRFATRAAGESNAHLTLLHAVQGQDPKLPIKLHLEAELHSAEKHLAAESLQQLLQSVGSNATARIAIGSVKDALLQAAHQSRADVLIIGRRPRSGTYGRLRDLTYAMIRDSPFPVLSV